jgi:ribosomal protein S12 methylthiotransferase accessory factor
MTFTRVRELLGLATGKDNGWYTLRIGELKAMLALAGGDLDQALIWTEWTMEFNQSVFSPSAPTTTAACKPCCC